LATANQTPTSAPSPAPAPATKTPAPAGKPQPPKPVVKKKAAAAKKTKPTVDPIVAAAESFCAGQSSASVEFLLIKHGLPQAKARQTADGMAAAYQLRSETKKQKKTAMWLSIVGGLALIAINLAASLIVQGARSSGQFDLLIRGFVIVGTILFFSGIWRFVAGPRPIRPAELIADWRKAKE
jgi:hypothetical protein